MLANYKKDLDALTCWQSKWQMKFNAQKCYVLKFTHARSPHNHTYQLNNIILAEKKEYPYLGVTLSSNLTWNSHITNTASKANRTLGFIRRNLYSCSSSVKNLAYKSLVRPLMEYCASVWDPHTKELIQKLEAIQNRGARFVLNNYDRSSSVTAMKEKLDWESLELRRKITRVATFQQAVTGSLAIPMQTILRPVQRSSRHGTYIQRATNKNCFKYSFIPKTLIEWNLLPSSIKEIKDKDKIKPAIRDYYNKQQ